MADEQDAGDRTHEPTPRRLSEARRRGEVSHSRDVGPTAALLVTTALVALYAGDASGRFAALLQLSIDSIGLPFREAASTMGRAALWTLVSVTLTVAIPIALVAVLAEFLHVGPVMSSHPMTPDFSRLDPVAGLKRMVQADSWIELGKSVAKTLLLLTIAVLVSAELLPRVGALHRGTPSAFGEALRVGTLQLLGWTLAVFVVVAILDALYQRHAFHKRMRMTRREVERESREDMGDPMIRQQRRALQRDWAQRSEVAAARSAHMLVVNPTHVAIALDWHPEHVPVPVVAGKGEDRLARRMREAAEDADVPVLRDVPLARALLERAEPGEVVPEALFDAVAQAIVWAQSMRHRDDADRSGGAPDEPAAGPESGERAGPARSTDPATPPKRPRRPRRPSEPPEGRH
ncbi:MAG: hypothetical protein RJA99_3832 [Pseudomonadota bacterium]|jgi:type III secretion protein U